MGKITRGDVRSRCDHRPQLPLACNNKMRVETFPGAACCRLMGLPYFKAAPLQDVLCEFRIQNALARIASGKRVLKTACRETQQ
jgi:hypothetical protein